MLRQAGKRVIRLSSQRAVHRLISSSAVRNQISRPKTRTPFNVFAPGPSGSRSISGGFFAGYGRQVLTTLLGAGLGGLAQIGVNRADKAYFGDDCVRTIQEDGLLQVVGYVAGYSEAELVVTIDTKWIYVAGKTANPLVGSGTACSYKYSISREKDIVNDPTSAVAYVSDGLLVVVVKKCEDGVKKGVHPVKWLT